MTRTRALFRIGVRLALISALCGCASFPSMQVATTAPDDIATEASETARSAAEGTRTPRAAIQIPPLNPAAPRQAVPEATPEQIAALVPDEPLGASLPPQPLPQFLNTVFREILGIPYSLGPNVGSRSDIITINAAPSTSKRNFIRQLQIGLRPYGLTLSIRGNSVVVSEEGAGAASTTTQVVRSRSSADTPLAARQVMQFFQLVALQADAVQPLVEQMVGTSVRISVDSVSNALVIQGQGRNVAQAVEILRNLDQPAFAGSQVIRLEPAFWSATDFALALQSTLAAEGFVVSTDPLGPKSILILPLASTNQTLAFAADSATMERVRYWARELDQPNAVGDRNATFVYEVRNTGAAAIGQMVINAGSMAPTLGGGGGFGGIQGAIGQPGGIPLQGGRGGGGGNQQLQQQLQQGGRGGNQQGGRGGGGGGGGGGRGGQFQAGRGGVTPAGTVGGAVPGGGGITIDEAGNRILFTGTATQFAQLRSLLRQLDTPAREVVVEVTVAEVTLTDETRVGLEFFFSNSAGARGLFSGGTLTTNPTNGLGLGAAGFGLEFLRDSPTGTDLRAAFNAFASNNKVNVLSQPRLTARSGMSAEITVGAEVPFVQQRQTPTNGTTADVIQTFSYRETGVILRITPVVYGDDRVDITVYQEVSDDQENPNPDTDQPIFNIRSIDTTLSLQDGATAVLGGLMEDNFSKGNRGIPFLKDIPVWGQAFRTDSVSGRKTALVMLITPFIVRDTEDMNNLARQMTDEINAAFRTGRGGSYTLTPYATGLSVGLNPPSPIVKQGLTRPEPPPAKATP